MPALHVLKFLIRFSISIAFAFVAVVILGAAIVSPYVAHDTIERSREIRSSFNLASQFILKFEQEHGRLPSESEFRSWATTMRDQEGVPRGLANLRIVAGAVTKEFEKEFGPAPDHGYSLAYWRGEWDETYVSWGEQRMIGLDKWSLSLVGQLLLVIIPMVLLSGILFLVAFKL